MTTAHASSDPAALRPAGARAVAPSPNRFPSPRLLAVPVVIAMAACTADLAVPAPDQAAGDAVEDRTPGDPAGPDTAGPLTSPSPDQLPPGVPHHAWFPSDTYDRRSDRYFASDCALGAVVAFDFAAGSRAVIADQWPWPGQPAQTICPGQLALEPGGHHLQAFVSRAFPDPDGNGGFCVSFDLVQIDVATGGVTPEHNYYVHCCDDCGPDESYASPLVDAFRRRVLFLEDNCDPNACYTSDVRSLSLTTGDTGGLVRLFERDCSQWPDDEECWDNVPSVLARDIAFHPRKPWRRVLALMSDDAVVSVDVVSGAVTPVATIQRQWGSTSLRSVVAMAVDAAVGRVFVLARGKGQSAGIVSLDLHTGAQQLLYDGAGAPGPSGDALTCFPREIAYDTKAHRVLLYEPSSTNAACAGDAYAVDVSTGALSRLPL